MLTVFKFTFLQQIKNKIFKITTLIVAIILLLVSSGGILTAQMLIGDDVKSEIDYVIVSDKSKLSGCDYNVLHESGNELYSHIVFINTDKDAEAAAKEAGEKSKNAVAMEVTDNESGYSIKIIMPDDTELKKKVAKKLSGYISDNIKYVLCEKVGVTDEQKCELVIESDSDTYVVGETEKSIIESAVKIALPIVFGFILYIMLASYGQIIAQSIVLEKSSKIIESMIIMVKPYNIIFGKLLALCLSAVIQFTVWILSIALGVGTGMLITESMNKGGESVGVIISDMLSSLIKAGAFSPQAILFSLLSLIIGFILFSALAGLFGSFASKSEEVSAAIGTYMMFVVIGWILPYINVANGNDHVTSILRFVPFTSPFIVPADILIGNMKISDGLISMAIMIATSVLVVALAAKVYHLLILYNGAVPKIKDILKMAKGSKAKCK